MITALTYLAVVWDKHYSAVEEIENNHNLSKKLLLGQWNWQRNWYYLEATLNSCRKRWGSSTVKNSFLTRKKQKLHCSFREVHISFPWTGKLFMLFEMLPDFCTYTVHNRIKHSKSYLYNFILQCLSKYFQTPFKKVLRIWEVWGKVELRAKEQ